MYVQRVVIKNLNLNSYFFVAKFHTSKSLCCSHMIESCLHWKKINVYSKIPTRTEEVIRLILYNGGKIK